MLQRKQTMGAREEDMKNALLCVASALVLAWPAMAQAQAPTAGNLEKLSDFKTTGTPMDIPQVPQTGAKADAIKKNLAQHQAAARLQDRALCDRSRCAPHRGRAAGRRHVRRHAQEQGLVGHRPRQGSRRRRGQGVRALDRLRHPERRLLLEGRLPLHRRAEPRAGLSRPPSSSTRARTSPPSRWSSRAS